MKNKVYRTLTIVCFIVLLLLIISGIRQKYASPVTVRYTEIYIVKPGDTLWSISKQYTKGDPRKFIYDIEKLNDISPDILPGQQIKVPGK